MSPRKLSDDDKQEILQLYRQSDATTSTLAERYEVSSSTVSRFLKNNLSKSEYEALIQQKRLAHAAKRDHSAVQSIQQDNEKLASLPSKPTSVEDEKLSSSIDESNTSDRQETSLVRRRRRRSSVSSELEEPITTISAPKQKPKIQVIEKETESPRDREEDFLAEEPEDKEFERVEAITLGAMLGEDLLDLDDEDDDELDEDEDEDWDAEIDKDLSYPHAGSTNIKIKILPLAAASFPRTCYLVVDRTAELITRPLEDFADLGTIPDSEVQQQTLPVFDNHRVARRFSHRRERVIKVPDGRMLQKTSHYLQAKGITRLLMDGQIYSL